MWHEHRVYTLGGGLHGSSCSSGFHQWSEHGRMCKQHADVYLRRCNGGSQLPVDSTNECYDCIGSGHADGYGIGCLELWSKWQLECSFTELFWLEYNTHTDGVQYTGNTGRHYWHRNECMFWCCVNLQHSRCTRGDELLVDSTC